MKLLVPLYIYPIRDGELGELRSLIFVEALGCHMIIHNTDLHVRVVDRKKYEQKGGADNTKVSLPAISLSSKLFVAECPVAAHRHNGPVLVRLVRSIHAYLLRYIRCAECL